MKWSEKIWQNYGRKNKCVGVTRWTYTQGSYNQGYTRLGSWQLSWQFTEYLRKASGIPRKRNIRSSFKFGFTAMYNRIGWKTFFRRQWESLHMKICRSWSPIQILYKTPRITINRSLLHIDALHKSLLRRHFLGPVHGVLIAKYESLITF